MVIILYGNIVFTTHCMLLLSLWFFWVLLQVEHVYSGQVYVDGGGAAEAAFTTSNM